MGYTVTPGTQSHNSSQDGSCHQFTLLSHLLTYFCSFQFFCDVSAPPAVGGWEEMELRASRRGWEKGLLRVYTRLRRGLALASQEGIEKLEPGSRDAQGWEER